jgi:hypothetical protein
MRIRRRACVPRYSSPGGDVESLRDPGAMPVNAIRRRPLRLVTRRNRAYVICVTSSEDCL